MLGVAISDPKQPMSENPISSARITMMLGSDDLATENGTPNRMAKTRFSKMNFNVDLIGQSPKQDEFNKIDSLSKNTRAEYRPGYKVRKAGFRMRTSLKGSKPVAADKRPWLCRRFRDCAR